MRVLLSALLCLVFAVTSVATAVMRSEMQGSSEMTICADAGGAGLTTLTFDATGNPIPHPHNCPDCLASLATATLPDQAVPIRPLAVTKWVFVIPQAAGTGRPSPAATARGPPSFV